MHKIIEVMNEMQEIPKEYQYTSPAGAETRLLMSNHLDGMLTQVQ
ncbi:hypothetical protein [Legionella birminghamensis]|nr:hypothetical protein [Legionella birminghamensis]